MGLGWQYWPSQRSAQVLRQWSEQSSAFAGGAMLASTFGCSMVVMSWGLSQILLFLLVPLELEMIMRA